MENIKKLLEEANNTLAQLKKKDEEAKLLQELEREKILEEENKLIREKAELYAQLYYDRIPELIKKALTDRLETITVYAYSQETNKTGRPYDSDMRETCIISDTIKDLLKKDNIEFKEKIEYTDDGYYYGADSIGSPS